MRESKELSTSTLSFCKKITNDVDCIATQKENEFISEKFYSLYIGDLSENIKEIDLYEIFSRIGKVYSLKVCRDFISGKSLGYGYVNFHKVKDAEFALERLNFYSDNVVFFHPIRLMWKNKDDTLRKSGFGNLFIKNLPPLFNSKSLFETFSVFGRIFSCKVTFEKKGKSIGYGFVHFENSQCSIKAGKKLNGLYIGGKNLVVSPFLNKKERNKEWGGKSKYTNIYVKNIKAENCTENYIKMLFQNFGQITSVFVPHVNKIPRGFAFVNFSSALDAKKAVRLMNNQKVGSSVLYVGKAETKKERKKILERLFLDEKIGLHRDCLQKVIIIKNLKKNITENDLLSFLMGYGKINNCKIIRNNNKNSKNLGLVNFENNWSISNIKLSPNMMFWKENIVIKISKSFFNISAKKNIMKKSLIKEKLVKACNNKYYICRKNFPLFDNRMKKEKKTKLMEIFSSLPIKTRKTILDEILFTWIEKINKPVSKKLSGVLLFLDYEKIVSLLLSENLFYRILEKLTSLFNLIAN
nr:polyadenylate-binding protein [Cryptomonas sp.]